jgi:hypothetical protein
MNMPTASLVPAETVERILISSTSRFVAEYEADGITITHVWPGPRDPTGSRRLEEGPLSRCAFMLSFIVPEVPRLPGQMIPGHELTGERVCALLSLLYGKRFDIHGAVQHHGHFLLPHLGEFNSVCMHNLPQNDHKPRLDIAVPLDLRQVARLSLMFTSQVTDRTKAEALESAAKFYWQALQNAESDAEVAYLHLITAGEILANAHHPKSDDLLDEDVRTILDQVRQHVPDGEDAARILTNRMWQIKRRFRLAVEKLVDDQFFSVCINVPKRAKFRRDGFSKCVSAAYDIRSRYVHSGLSFGGWIAPRSNGLEEIRHDIPELKVAPTYVGLERVIRYCLIRFAEQHKLIIDMTAEHPAS